jgi:glycosyltransferase involved in cell wall biosynthesis
VVVGKDCDKYNADFDVEARGLGNNIHYPGWIEQGDLPAIYSLASAFVFPSVYEEFGIPVVEAISTGCPVISSSTGAIPDLLGDAALLCDPFDTEQLTKNILSVTQDDQVREALIRKGFDRSQQFSWNLAASATLAIFDEVCHA